MSKMRKLTVDRSENKTYSRCQKKLSGVKIQYLTGAVRCQKMGVKSPSYRGGI